MLCVIDEQKFVWRGELNAGSYLLMPFTTGCRLMKSTKKTSTKPAQLVNRTQSGELELTKEFKLVNSNIGGPNKSLLSLCLMLNVSFWLFYVSMRIIYSMCAKMLYCFVPQGGIVWHLWSDRFGRQRSAEPRGVQLLWTENQWREMWWGCLGHLQRFLIQTLYIKRTHNRSELLKSPWKIDHSCSIYY